MRHSFILMICLTMAACGSSQRATPQPPATWTIPAGPGEWAIVERERPLESLGIPRLILPYGAASMGRALKNEEGVSSGQDVVRYQVVFKPDPLAAGDRCALELLAFQVVHADGSIRETPAKGHVVDNSDRGTGFRAVLSTMSPSQLVIPAHATATVVFEEPVTVRSR